MQYKNLLRWTVSEPNAQLLWLGRTSTFLAEQTSEIALTWFTWQLTHSSAEVGLIAFLLRAPYWAFGWISGIYADRLPRKTLLVFANLVGASIAVSIPLLHMLGALNYWILSLLAFLFASSRTIEFPVLGAEITELFPREAIGFANAILDNAKRIGRLLGPILSSLLQMVIAVPFLYFVVAFCLLIMSFCSSRFKTIRKMERLPRKNLFQELRVAWSVLRKERKLFLIIVCFSLYNPVYAIGYWILLPRFIATEISGSGITYSLAVAAFSFGALIGNFSIGSIKFKEKVHGPLLGFLVVGLGFTFLSFSHSTATAFLSIMAAAWGMPLMDVGMASMINEQIPINHQGKVFALFRYFAEIGLAAGLLGGGYLADSFGSRFILSLPGLYLIPLVAFFYWVIKRAPESGLTETHPLERSA